MKLYCNKISPIKTISKSYVEVIIIIGIKFLAQKELKKVNLLLVMETAFDRER